MASRTELGTYLRTRRQLVKPHDVGLEVGARPRRVAGLRREEVAVLAGISAEYYLRLEQGRDRNPTRQVLDSLARALLLDANGAAYLNGLVNTAAPMDDRSTDEITIQQASWLIDSWPMTAAMVLNPRMDILASNPLMRALVPPFAGGGNTIRAQFTDPRLRSLYRDWERLSARTVAHLRMSTGLAPESPETRALVAQLSAESPRFRELWERSDVISVRSGVHVMNHPDLGELYAHYAHLPLAGSDNATIFAYHAEPGSPTERAFARLSATL